MTASIEPQAERPDRPLEKQYAPVEIAHLSGFEVRTIREMCRDGKIPGAHKVNNQWRVGKNDLAKWLEGKL